jgi:hypothetical protein
MVEKYFVMEVGTKKGQKLKRADDFLAEEPLITEKDIDEKMMVESMQSQNAAPYLEDAISMIMGAL